MAFYLAAERAEDAEKETITKRIAIGAIFSSSAL
jgi:hypothetical protein